MSLAVRMRRKWLELTLLRTPGEILGPQIKAIRRSRRGSRFSIRSQGGNSPAVWNLFQPPDSFYSTIRVSIDRRRRQSRYGRGLSFRGVSFLRRV